MCRGNRCNETNQDYYTYWDNTGKIIDSKTNIQKMLPPIKEADEENKQN